MDAQVKENLPDGREDLLAESDQARNILAAGGCLFAKENDLSRPSLACPSCPI
jgi:hypothetical protein